MYFADCDAHLRSEAATILCEKGRPTAALPDACDVGADLCQNKRHSESSYYHWSFILRRCSGGRCHGAGAGSSNRRAAKARGNHERLSEEMRAANVC